MPMYGPSWRDDLYGDYIDTGDDLMHYGVLGMRWGHRKGSSGSSSARQRLENWGNDSRAKKRAGYKNKAQKVAERSKKRQSKGSKRLKKAAAIAGAAALAGGAAYQYSKNRNNGSNALAVVNNNRSMQTARSRA